MSFVITKERLAWVDIEWTSLDGAGEQVTNAIRMKVELVDLDRFDAFVKTALVDGTSGESGDQPKDFIRAVVRGWEGVLIEGDGETNEPFPFSAPNLDIVIQAPGFLLGWTMSYIKAWNGQVAVREKNSEGSPAAGPAGRNRKARRARSSSSRRSAPK